MTKFQANDSSDPYHSKKEIVYNISKKNSSLAVVPNI